MQTSGSAAVCWWGGKVQGGHGAAVQGTPLVGMSSWGAGWCWSASVGVVKPKPSLNGPALPAYGMPRQQRASCFPWAFPYFRKECRSRNISKSQDLDGLFLSFLVIQLRWGTPVARLCKLLSGYFCFDFFFIQHLHIYCFSRKARVALASFLIKRGLQSILAELHVFLSWAQSSALSLIEHGR